MIWLVITVKADNEVSTFQHLQLFLSRKNAMGYQKVIQNTDESVKISLTAILTMSNTFWVTEQNRRCSQ